MKEKSRKWTDEQLVEAVKTSQSIRSTLQKLGVIDAGANRRLVKRIIEKLSIDTSHFSGKGHLKGKRHNWNGEPLENLLIKDSTFTSTNHLKKRLIKNFLLEEVCIGCDNSTWITKLNNEGIVKIPLQLDHLNGVRTDNRLENLRLLCPNCHSLTPTFAGKNINKGVRKVHTKKKYDPKTSICICGNPKHETSVRCRACSPPPSSNTINWPEINTLKKMLSESNKTQVAKIIGCTRQAITLHMRKFEDKIPTYCQCGKEKFPNAKLCRSCVGKLQATKITWPSDEDLINLIKNSSYLAVGKSLGVSDNAVRKRLRNRGYNTTSIS